MLPKNRLFADIVRATKWHKLGFTGTGVKIGLVDSDLYAARDYYDGKVHAVPELKRGFYTGRELTHGQQVADILHQYAPDADIYPLSPDYPTIPGYPDSLKWAKANGINIISMSMGGSAAWEAEEKELYNNGTVFFCAAGNSSRTSDSNTLTVTSRLSYWFSVGSVVLGENQIKKAENSSIGPHLDTMGITGQYTHEAVIPFTGTSCATPVVAGMTACWFQWFKTFFDRYPTPQETIQFIIDNSMDIGPEGFDPTTGNGLFRLPEEIVTDEIILTIGRKDYIHNGQKKDMDTAPFIRDGRTYLPIRFPAEAMRDNVEYDASTKVVKITKAV